MKRKSPQFMLLPALLLLLYSCVSELPFGEEFDGMPTVNCLLKNDSVQTLNLTRAVKISDSYIFKKIPDAEISLSANDSIVGYFTKLTYATWELKLLPVSGKEYQLKVILTDGKELTASTKMPYWTHVLPNVIKDKFPSKNFEQLTADLPCWMMIFSSGTPLLGSSCPQKDDLMYPQIGTDHPRLPRESLRVTGGASWERIKIPEERAIKLFYNEKNNNHLSYRTSVLSIFTRVVKGLSYSRPCRHRY